MARILVTEKIADTGLQRLRDAGHEVVVREGLSADELAHEITTANALIIRSATQVTPDVLEKAGSLVVVGRAGIGLDNVEFITAPWQPYPEDENRVELKPEADQLWRQMRLDKPLGATFTEEVVRASDRVDGKPRRGQGGGAQAGGGSSASPGQDETTSAEQRSEMAAANGLCG